MKSKTFKGLIETTEGLSMIEMYQVSLDDLKEANAQTAMVMGFRLLYGRTEDGRVFEFIKAGRLAKRDLEVMKKLGVVESVCSWCFAPKQFEIPQGRVPVSATITLGGKETERLMEQWTKVLL
jgi:hypothetical protein